MVHKILAIEDDFDCIQLLESVFKNNGYDFLSAPTGLEGLRMAYEHHPDLIILDVMLPDLDGFEVCCRLRELSDVPILMLTARGTNNDLLRGFSSGADDYVRKPFSNEELLARVGALLRRQHPVNQQSIKLTRYADGRLEIDLDRQIVTINGKAISLTPTEFRVLALLASHPKQVLSPRTVALHLWGSNYDFDHKMLSVYIYNLRKKLNDGQNGHQYIKTQWGMGYWFNPGSLN
jgi:two-component system KDP operon response regulator KdpE